MKLSNLDKGTLFKARHSSKASFAPEVLVGGEAFRRRRLALLSFMPNQVCFCSVGTNVIPVRRGRFAPACCAAQSVSRRGPGCAVPHHRLPWSALNFHHRSGLHQQRASAGPMNTVRSSSSSSLSRPNECGLTGRSTGHFAAGQVWASKA